MKKKNAGNLAKESTKRDSDSLSKTADSSNKRNVDTRRNTIDGGKKAAIEKAKKEDKWDVDFIETMQNKRMFENDDMDAMIKAYEKYYDMGPDEFRIYARKYKDA